MRNYIVLLFMVSAFVSLPIQARNYQDRQFPDQIVLDGTDQPLQLNGIGMRTKLFFDIYIGALYTETSARTRDDVLQQKGPKRMLMHFVYDEVGVDKLIAGWKEGFEENQSEDRMAVLQERINAFNAMFSTVKTGDEVLLDYVPGKGTIVTIKGESKGQIEGEDFYAALLDIWLGDEPADDDLKQALLGN